MIQLTCPSPQKIAWTVQARPAFFHPPWWAPRIGAVADHAPNPTFSLCNLNHLRAFAPNSPNCVCYSRIRGGSPPHLLHEFHAGQHASHYGVLEFRSPLTACGITAAVDGVDRINQGDSNSLAAHSREPGIESGIVKVGPSSPFPTRTKMRLKLLAAGIPTATSPDGAHPARPGRPRRTPPLSRRSVISQPTRRFIVERASPAMAQAPSPV
jgi:hypothetical protein